ncbi:MAG: copper amine oxidase N-terminal domain-containing protein [Dysgonamonadaceae bacterium]|nr:copper amine oxidase N-terminal domain-containing protein [Dysgonamonadaceae bacterium]
MRKIALPLLFAILLFGSGYAVSAYERVPVIYVNGQQIYCDASPQIVDGRTMVPLSIIARALNKEVTWNESEWRVDIRDKQIVVSNNELNERIYLSKLGETRNLIVEGWNYMNEEWNAWGMLDETSGYPPKINKAMEDLENPPAKYVMSYQYLKDIYITYNEFYKFVRTPSEDYIYGSARIYKFNMDFDKSLSGLDTELQLQ